MCVVYVYLSGLELFWLKRTSYVLHHSLALYNIIDQSYCTTHWFTRSCFTVNLTETARYETLRSLERRNKRPKGPLSLTWVQSTLQKFDFRMEPKTTTLHPTCFKITAFHSVRCYNLLGWRSFWNVPPSLMDMPGWQFLFTFRPEKHKLGRGR